MARRVKKTEAATPPADAPATAEAAATPVKSGT